MNWFLRSRSANDGAARGAGAEEAGTGPFGVLGGAEGRMVNIGLHVLS